MKKLVLCATAALVLGSSAIAAKAAVVCRLNP
jgi:hypothetical protein